MIIHAFYISIVAIITLITLVQALSGEINKRAAIVCFAVLFIINTILVNLLPESMHSVLGMILLVSFPVITAAISVRKVLFIQLVYLSLLVQGLIVLISSLFYWIACLILRSDLAFALSAIDMATVLLLLIICIITSRAGILGKVAGNLMAIKAKLKCILLGSIWLSVLLASLSYTIYVMHNNLHELIVTGILTALLIMLMGIVFPLLIVSTLSNEHYKKVSSMMDIQVQAQAAHYEAMAIRNEENRRFRHDYENQKLAIINFLKRNDVANALAFLEEGTKTGSMPDNIFETGNVVLDALLYEKQSAAAEVNARIEFIGVVPGNLISLTDVCVIFGNALDNAIEACAKCSVDVEKAITVQSTFTNGFLFISVSNPVDADVKIVNNTIATAKENKAAHGVGLQSMRAAVEKYSGSMVLYCENRVFRVEIDLDFNNIQQIAPAT